MPTKRDMMLVRKSGQREQGVHVKDVRWRYALGVVLSTLLLALAFWNADWPAMWSSVRQAHRGLLALAVVGTALGLWMRARRWAVLFWPQRRVDRQALLDGVNVGYLVNNVLPARVGDVVRSYVVAEWTGIRLAHVLSTTVLERLVDSLIIVVLFFLLIPLFPISARLGGVAFLVLVGILVLFVVVTWQRHRLHAWLMRALEHLPGVDGQKWASSLSNALAAFEVVRTPRALMVTLGWSVLVWGEGILVYWLVLRAFGLEVSPAVAALAIVAAALGLALPSAPAGVGTYEGAVLGALLLVGVEENAARGAVITLHAVNFVTLNAAGIWSLARRGMGYRDLARWAGRVAEQAPS
ncbi:MAG: lysylphosphatidylglycerol synthase transmembrane domain-containing protein [Ardenticatenia bacterium]|nr:lysylphosphatidylglycerol synthase transmembrane domain-containing protein [Ardenticatenia bacterium]